MDSGEILYEKNAREQRAVASTTKIMTALLTLEAAALENPEVEITQEMVLVEGSSMGLRAGGPADAAGFGGGNAPGLRQRRPPTPPPLP